ncbi:MAG: sirohydrochlorin chelatase [Gomphosphaeria aponina SAG 52.96 = DSM 107014]|uniref:Sirohydrochlorin chelatase n=1 Tax=Gomphosphaeria aponina SAG 52.96 = DSM 107014 TaxID=1521640 RepID=A0A941GV41_9CHRO|nr:sirohydrochlorin chelatase [Gomphosphaeria aponina SAG 52.96 = DSM 107014]
MGKKTAYLLVFHGSRDPRPQKAVSRLAELVIENLTSLGENSPQVATAALELGNFPLNESIRQVAWQGQNQGCKRLKILPLLLLPGVHVEEDIPAEVALAAEFLGEEIELELLAYLGSYGGMINLLAKQFAQLPATEGRILLAHGSRRLGANLLIEAIAFQLQAMPAFWAVSPSLTEQVMGLITAGKRDIAILPYFLFSGGITEAIAAQCTQLQLSFPQTQLFLGELYSQHRELASLITSILTVSH